jgi:DNA-binding winged helix-turn-helix (wHTH) protein/tetratricopeptide (TPR) repeat protein
MPQALSDLSSLVSLDLTNECLWRGTQAFSLRPKTFAVLRMLVERPGQLVSKTALLDTVWPETAVGDGVLMVCICELRRVLEDDPKTPRFIETVHRRGYRLIGHITVTNEPGGAFPSTPSLQPVAPHVVPAAVRVGPTVGREAELGQLHAWLHRALNGRRQVVFVTGEAGLGKTTVIETFLDTVRGPAALWIGRGQCIEHYGAGEAYLPVLEAFGRLCQAPGGEDLMALLARRAPTWLVQMPWLLSTADLETVQRRVMGATRERMLREMAETIEGMTASRPLILVFEDLHWSDYSTLALIATLARWQEPARLLLLGTYRPTDAAMRDHPLHRVQQELHVHALCAELLLTFLPETAIAAYVALRFPGAQLPGDLAPLIHQRTEGNPLFMVNMVTYWVAQGWLVEEEAGWTLGASLPALQAGMPASLQHMIDMQLDRLSPEEQRVLEAGSVAGVEFSAAAVAAGLENDVMGIDERCAALARRSGVLQACGEQVWPDGTVAGRYRFAHALYQEVLYSRLTVARRVYLHRQLGMRLEAGYGTQMGDIAAELARHFEQGRDVQRAVAYLRQAASSALHRYANREAIDALTKGLALLSTLPQTPERSQQELDLLLALGPALMATKGYGALEVEHTYAQALTLCQQMGETPQLFPVLVGLQRFYVLRAELQTARALCERLLTMAQHTQDVALLLIAHQRLGTLLVFQGEFALARDHLEHGIALYDAQRSRSHILLHGDDAGAGFLSYLAIAQWLLGHVDQAQERMQAALALARELEHPFSLAYALIAAAWFHQYRQEAQATQAHAQEAIALSR